LLEQYRELQRSPDGLFSKLLVKPLELILLPVVVRLPFSPHLWTVLSFAVKILAGVWLLQGLDCRFVPLWLLLALILDGFDGDVARWQDSSSFTGAYLDRGLDRIANCFIISGFLIVASDGTNSLLYLLLAFLVMGGEILHETLRVWISLTGGLLAGRNPLPGWDRWLRERGFLLFYAQDTLYFIIGVLPFFLSFFQTMILLTAIIWASFLYLLINHYMAAKNHSRQGVKCSRALLRVLLTRLSILSLLFGGGFFLQIKIIRIPEYFYLFFSWTEFLIFYLAANHLMSLSSLIPEEEEKKEKFIKELQEKDLKFLAGWLP
jgi:phosphatidylglycerophosphate synthase